MRNIIKCISASATALAVTSCSGDDATNAVFMVFVLGAIAVFMAVIIIIAKELNKQKEDEEKARLELEEKRKAELEERRKAYESKLAALNSEIGRADKTIIFGEYDLDNEIRVYSGRNSITIFGKSYDFKAILSCTSTDDYSVKRGKAKIDTSGDTSTDTIGAVGRAVVGGLIAGEAGAIIGGATAGSSTSMTGTIKYGDDRILHNYTVWVTVRDIATPTIEIHTGADARLTNEVVALMNVIIEGNKA